MCIETVDYSVLVNREAVGPIIAGRGLRQGDPLSSYLFIIWAEGLSCLIKRVEAQGELGGTSVCRGTLLVTHLLFADDYFMFFKEEVRQGHIMKDILTMYEAASGQAISLPKFKIFYSRGVPEDLRMRVRLLWVFKPCWAHVNILASRQWWEEIVILSFLISNTVFGKKINS